ncbi:MAG: GNAT family N-acetyltransferase [Burkholderiales bacterium]
MTITFKAVEKPNADLIDSILHIEKAAFGNGALNEYVVIPLMRHGRIYVAVDEEDEAIACAYFLRDMTDPYLAYLLSIAVLPKFSGFDIGVAMLDFALTDIKELGIEKVQLTVDPANFKALSTYREKLGFSVSPSIDEYGTGDERLTMIKEL